MQEVEGIFRLLVGALTSFVKATEYLYKKLLAPGVTYLHRNLREHRDASRASTWTMAIGSVEWVLGAEDSFQWTAQTAYSYKVEGLFYSGFKYVPFGRERDLKTYLDRFRTGVPLCVRHSPQRPEVSVVLQREQFTAFDSGETTSEVVAEAGVTERVADVDYDI